jgi:hypothetical protein
MRYDEPRLVSAHHALVNARVPKENPSGNNDTFFNPDGFRKITKGIWVQ